MPAEKSNALKEGQKELKRLRLLKQEILGKMPKKKNIFTKALVLLLEEQLHKLEDKIKEAEEKLIEATKITDIVNPDVLDKVKDIVEDVAEGRTDDAVEIVKDIAEEELDKIIDKKIKDGTIADTAKDVIDRVMDGDLDGVVDVIKDGAKEKAKEEAEKIIDKKIKDEKIAEMLKGVVDGAIDGEWDTLLDIVKDGVVDIAEGKLEEFIYKLLELFEAQIKIKIELDMNKEVKALIPKALDAGKGNIVKSMGLKKTEIDVHWTVKLIQKLTSRLLSEMAAIIKTEIKRLTSKGGLKILSEIAKDALIETLKSGLFGRKIKDILKELVANIAKHEEFKKIIHDLKRKVLSTFIRVVEEEVRKAVLNVLAAYLRVHSPWVGTLLNTNKSVKIGPLWGCINLVLGIDLSLKASLAAKQHKTKAIGKADMSGAIKGRVGIYIGYDIPLVGDISIEGGVEFGPKISAYAALEIGAENSVIYAKVSPATIDVNVEAELYLRTPIPNRILKYVPAYLSSIVVRDQTLYRKLGEIILLRVTTPHYKFTFDLVAKKYAYIKTPGQYDIALSENVKAYLREVKDAIAEAAQSVVDAVDPTNWDLNPFDDEGWIGSLF